MTAEKTPDSGKKLVDGNGKWSLEKDAGGTAVRWKSFSPLVIFAFVFLAVGIIMFFAMGGREVISRLSQLRERFAWYPLMAPDLLSFVITAAGVYIFLAGILNGYRITVRDKVIRLAYGPVPWPHGLRMRAEDVRQIFCMKDSGSYALMLLTSNGRTRTLLPDTPGLEKAQKAEAALESALGITDMAVRGEAANPSAHKDGAHKLWAPPKDIQFEEKNDTMVCRLLTGRMWGLLTIFFGASFLLGAISVTSSCIGAKADLFQVIAQAILWVPAVAILYAGVGTIVNSRVVTLAPGEISYSIGPLPWPGGQKIPAGGITGAGKETHVHHGRNGTYHSYELRLKMKDGLDIDLTRQALSENGVDFVLALIRSKYGVK